MVTLLIHEPKSNSYNMSDPTITGFEKFIPLNEFQEKHTRIVYLTPPHTPSVVTTCAPNGGVNIGTFEQTMLCSNWPPIILLAISPKSDTLHNLRETGECVIGFVYIEHLQALYDAGVRLAREESELKYINDFTTASSKKVKPPRLEQCWFSAEGKLLWDKETGDHVVCAVEIQEVVFDERLWNDNRVVRRCGVPTAHYATSGYFNIGKDWKKFEQSPDIQSKKHAD